MANTDTPIYDQTLEAHFDEALETNDLDQLTRLENMDKATEREPFNRGGYLGFHQVGKAKDIYPA